MLARLCATLLAVIALLVLGVTGSGLTHCTEALGIAEGPRGEAVDLPAVCAAGMREARDRAEAKSSAELVPLEPDARTTCACRLSSLHAHRLVATVLFVTAIAFVALALLVAWRGRRTPAAAPFALFAGFVAYAYAFYLALDVTYQFPPFTRRLAFYAPDLPIAGVLANTLAAIAWICAPLAFAAFARMHPATLSAELLLRTLREVFVRVRKPRAPPTRARLAIMWVLIAIVYAASTVDAWRMPEAARWIGLLLVLALLFVYLRPTLAMAPCFVAIPVLASVALQWLVVVPDRRDFTSAAAFFGTFAMIGALGNLLVGYRFATPSQRRNARWMGLGFVIAAAMLAVSFAIEMVSFDARICGFIGTCDAKPTLAFFAVPVLGVFLAVSIFYKGELDPKLIVWRGTVYTLVVVATGAIFGLVEHVVAHYMSAILFAGAPPTIAACVSAVAVKPVKDVCERLVEFGVHRLTGD